jgi:hypothetical protein
MENNLNEEIRRIRSLIYEHDTTKKNPSTRNEDFISLYEKFNITFDNKTISVLNEQGLIKKVKEGLSELGRKIRGMVQNKWAKKQKLPTKDELMENDKKNSPAIVTHPAYKDTIELMYRKKIRNATAILYWYYGEGFVLGDEEIGDKASAQRGLDLLNQIYNNVESYKNTDFQKFISELQSLYDDGIYIDIDILTESLDQNTKYLSSLLGQRGKDVAYTKMGGLNTSWIKYEDAQKKFRVGQIQKDDKGKYYHIVAVPGQTSQRYEVEYKKNEDPIVDSELKTLEREEQDMTIFRDITVSLKELAAGGKVTMGLKFTDEEKMEVLEYVENEASYAEQSILKATSFDIQPKDVGIDVVNRTTEEVVVGEGKYMIYTFQFPDNTNLEQLKTTIYNDDNQVDVPPSGLSALKGAVNDAIKAVKDEGYEIVQAARYAGSSTSTVGTAHGSSSGARTEANNVNLVNDRCSKINEAVDVVISSSLPGIEVIKLDDKKFPNQGPGWYTNKGDHGPLYTAWANTFSNLLDTLDENMMSPLPGFAEDYRTNSWYAPVYFYKYKDSSIHKNAPFSKNGINKMINELKKRKKSLGNHPSRKEEIDKIDLVLSNLQSASSSYSFPSSEQLKSEYEFVYGKYRNSWATFMITGKDVDVEEPTIKKFEDIKIKTKGDWEVMITFEEKTKPPNEKPPKPPKTPPKINWPKLKFKFNFKWPELPNLGIYQKCQDFCEDAYQGSDRFK